MLTLREIELLGFKSFADRTRLVCEGSTVAVVGPNGCGKSNLADAVSWVLGEQSARTLRGERMLDVIFNGTGTRPPTGLAEVSMTLVKTENDAESVVSAGDEIKVTRRLFRSGESEYLLNGQACRLRDIQDIFMGTGLGPESYAIIEQGRIGQILSSKPTDRRAIIEEAAGISKFKSRKRLAEAKLESSRQNLSRIHDILEEITKQSNSLKRQASKAARYRELKAELRERQQSVFASRLKTLALECTRFTEELGACDEQCRAAAAQADALERERKSLGERHESVESEIAQLRDTVAQHEVESERLRSRMEQARQKASALDARITEAGEEREECVKRAAALDAEAREKHVLAEELGAARAAAGDAAKQSAARRAGISAELVALEAELERHYAEASQCAGRTAELGNQAAKAEELSASLDRQMARAQSELAGLEAECGRASAALEALRAEKAQADSELAGLERALAAADASLSAARLEEAGLRAKAEALRQQASQESARKQALEESLARHAYSTESVRMLLAHPPNGNGFHPLGVLADFLEVSPGYEAVVEDFLKTELDSVVVSRHQEARSGIALLESEGGGRSTFFVRDMKTNGHGSARPPLEEIRQEAGVVASLAEIVRFEPRLGLNGDTPFPVLERSFVVEDAGSAERLAGMHPSCHFVTRDGEHYHHRLVAGGKIANAGPLALRRDFRELERRAAASHAALAASEDRRGEAAALLERAQAERERLGTEAVTAEKRAILEGEKQRQAESAFRQTEQRLAALRSEATALRGEREQAGAQQVAFHSELDALRKRKQTVDQQLQAGADRVRSLRGRMEEANGELREAEVRSGALEERANAAGAEAVRAKAEAESARGKLAGLDSQTEFWKSESLRLGQEAAEVARHLTAAQAEEQSLRDALHRKTDESLALRGQRNNIEPQFEEAWKRLEESREKRSQIEVALVRAESGRQHQTQLCQEELGIAAEELQSVASLEGEQLQTAEEELREVKARIERLGPVNMMALEELQEAEERLTFLEGQRQDLLASINDTNQTIREIDEVSRRKFTEAFNVINRNFAESFKTLFGGGSGEMRFADEADADSGIDIVAQPPGKRLQNVLLLSGGEKALTALALLIGVFRFAPSPFCILDEVDAPLDESNVLRFTRMIREMSAQTQFILVTHNKRTMEICPILYGVTMQEPGVSKLVSVRFEAREPEVALAASA